jgi:hypothetical protein
MPTNNAPVPSAPDSSIERLRAVWIHRLLSIGAPWIVGALTLIAANRCHQAWGGHGGRTAAAVAGLASGTVVVSAAAWLTARHHPMLMRAHGAATAAVAGGWLCLATITGQRAPATAYLGIVLGITVCLTWNLRRAHKPSVSGAESAAERISELLTDAAAPAGVKGATMTVREVSGRKARGVARLVPGEQTADDFIRRMPHLESGAKLPPGSLVASPHLDRADLAEFTLTDPRIMRKPIPYPGPSIPGGSIAEPICPGLWQDADPVLWSITGHHVQLMGMTGAGKGFGGAWGYLGEVITREDVAIFAADITKGDQTLGPLRPALHRLETTMQGTRALLADMHAIIRPRTDYLASRGLQRWERGCGLTYLVLWLEECPDIFDQMTDKQMDSFTSLLKAIRSAGGSVALSLQRSTYDQMPTILRGQVANWCFGVQNSADGKYGLSERQDEANARPELWQNGQPGMAYLDTPGTPEDRIAMPMRCWYWGEDASIMTTLAASCPATDRPLDGLTARLLADAAAARTKAAGIAVPAPRAALGELPGPDDEDQDDEDEDDPETVRAEYLTEPDPDPELIAGIDDPISVPDDEFGALTFPAAPERIEPAEARERFRSQLTAWLDEGRRDFSTSDLYSLLSAVGLSRAWLHKQINAAIDDGLIEPVNDAEKGRFGRYELCEPESDAA